MVMCQARRDWGCEVLNIATTGGGQAKDMGTENGWITVDSKKIKRIVSCLNSAKTRSVHGNGKTKGKRVRFVEG